MKRGIVACALALALYHRFFATQEYATTLGEQKSVELSDHSAVTLNADSLIEARLDASDRDHSDL